jgi:hypothetical protein
MIEPTRDELIWIAGFWDGEGCFTIQRAKHVYDQFAYFQGRATIGLIQREPLELLAARFGGTVHPQRRKETGRVYHFWGAYGKRALAFVKAVRPFLRVKCRQADILLELDALMGKQGRWVTPESYARRMGLWVEMRQLNAGNSVRRAERLSELAPQVAGDATVRAHGNDNREKQGETPARLAIARARS